MKYSKFSRNLCASCKFCVHVLHLYSSKRNNIGNDGFAFWWNSKIPLSSFVFCKKSAFLETTRIQTLIWCSKLSNNVINWANRVVVSWATKSWNNLSTCNMNIVFYFINHFRMPRVFINLSLFQMCFISLHTLLFIKSGYEIDEICWEFLQYL